MKVASFLYLIVAFCGVSSHNVFKPTKPTCLDEDLYQGKWKITKATENGTDVYVPKHKKKEGGIVTMEFTKLNNKYYRSSADYELSIKAGNTYGTSLNITNQTENCFHTIEIDNVFGTKMWPPEQYRPIEAFIADHLEKMEMMKMRKRGLNLVMKGANVTLRAQYVVSRPPPPKKKMKHEYAGTWTLVEAMVNGTMVEYPEELVVGIQLTPNPEASTSSSQQYNFQAKAINKFWTDIDVLGPTMDGAYDEIMVGGVLSTRMGYDPEYAAIEGFFIHLEDMNLMTVNDENMLVMKGENAELLAKRG